MKSDSQTSSGTPIDIRDQSGLDPIAARSESETASALWPSRYGGVVVRRKSMSSTSRSVLMTVSFPELLRKTAASSPIPVTIDCDEDPTRWRSELMKSNSLLILRDYDEANRGRLRWFRSKWKKRSAGGSRLPRRRRCREQSRPARG